MDQTGHARQVKNALFKFAGRFGQIETRAGRVVGVVVLDRV